MSFSFLAILAALPVAAWIYLLALRGGFWRADQTLSDLPAPPVWPGVVAVVPARNEAATVGQAVASLIRQDYPGPFNVVLVDDGSEDGTADLALTAAREAALTPEDADRLSVLQGRDLPAGWVGKMWAVSQGVDAAATVMDDASFLLLADADIVHDSTLLSHLVAKAEEEKRDLVSLMVRLCNNTKWERLLIPAFVFFFQKLYPFPWVNDPGRSTAAAGGGCMLVRREALERAGGIKEIRGRIIDDCALAALIKAGGGNIWLGLARRARSLRGYATLGDIWEMVVRSAYVQLGQSQSNAAWAVFGMVMVYLVPPLAMVVGMFSGDSTAAHLGGAGWVLMAVAYAPTLEHYNRRPWHGLVLPLAALFYTAMIADSVRRAVRGDGATWKGRSYGGRSDREESAKG